MLPRLGLILVVLMVVALPWVGAAENADPAVRERLMKDVTYLASDECEGRGVNTKGINLAADYIAAEFKKSGLQPFDPKTGSYFQPFTMPASKAGVEPELVGTPSLVFQGPLGQTIDLRQGKDFDVSGISGGGKVSGPLVLVGYGVSAEKANYDDFKDVDVKDKVVLIIRKMPRGDNDAISIEGGGNGPHAALVAKAGNAVKHGAAAILIVNDSKTANADNDRLMNLAYAAGGGEVKVPFFHVRRDVVDQLLLSSLNESLRDVERDIDRTLTPRSAVLPGWKASVDVNINRPMLNVKNVVGVLEGAGPLAKETVVIGAHYDHLGFKHPGSLSRDPKPQIHHGADDNASGTTGLIDLARRFAAVKNRQGRRLVFVAFSGEESGLFGSIHYAANPLFPLSDTVAMFNLDMIGRLRKDKMVDKDLLLVEGSGTAKTFDGLLDQWNKKYDFKMVKKPSGFGPSDHDSFYAKKIPVLFYWTGEHPDYHKPSDTADKINVDGMVKILNMAEETIGHLATVEPRPEYVEIKRAAMGGRGSVPTIGIKPAYTDDGDGILLDGVAEGGPAEKAGLKGGDRIIAIEGKTFKGMEGYMPLMTGRQKGAAIEFTVERDGKKMMITVTP